MYTKFEGISFRELVSGPAPTGRILNYLNYVGKNRLKYDRTHRNTTFKKNVGDAWCIEFMKGLQLVQIDDNSNVIFKDYGRKIYDLIKKNFTRFDENSTRKAISSNIKKLLTKYPKAYEIFREVYLNAPITRNAFEYFTNKKSFVIKPEKFKNEFFSAMQITYNDDSLKELKLKSTNAGFNRLPSFIQLTFFFGYVSKVDKDYVFNFPLDYFKNVSLKEFAKMPVSEDQKKVFEKELSKIEIDIESLVRKYGEDGNVVSQITARSSNIQSKFKHNLLVDFDSKCCICDIAIVKMLVGSHIQPSSSSNLEDKINVNNGLVLCCNHDKLFDSHLISFDSNNGTIMVSDLIKDDLEMLNLKSNFKLQQKYLNSERKAFLLTHNLKFNEKNRTV